METQARIIIGDARRMMEVPEEAVHLIVTSPPYWHIKDYGVPGQIGYGQTLHEYLIDLSRVWQECWRVLRPGRRLCINVGDQFARGVLYGRYKVIPLHSEMIAQCEAIGFDYLGAIIWQKKTTMQTTGGANIMGSFPYPPNGIVELDYEFILLFKKPGDSPSIPIAIKDASRLSLEEWKEYFSGHWTFGGDRQLHHEATFPLELPRRLIRMFSFVGESVLDPFAGSGTTLKAALELHRKAIGYEIQADFTPIIEQKLGLEQPSLNGPQVCIERRPEAVQPVAISSGYQPAVQNAMPLHDPKQLELDGGQSVRVIEVLTGTTLRLENGATVRLLGILVPPEREAGAVDYLKRFVLRKRVLIRGGEDLPAAESDYPAFVYLYLTNKIFINRKMLEMGIAIADRQMMHPYREKFLQAEAKGDPQRALNMI